MPVDYNGEGPLLRDAFDAFISQICPTHGATNIDQKHFTHTRSGQRVENPIQCTFGGQYISTDVQNHIWVQMLFSSQIRDHI